MEPAVLTLSDGFLAIDPHGANADDLVDARDASPGFGQDLAR